MPEIKERPLCRKAILKLGIAPFLTNGIWDGRHAVDKEGQRGSPSDGMRKQMRKMVDEGVWGAVKTQR
jgi:hypothetical protein